MEDISSGTPPAPAAVNANDAADVLSDAELLERFFDRQDQSAFAALVSRHGPLVLGVCRRVLRNHADAEDAFQATFLVLAMKGRSIRKRNSLPDWLFGVALRTANKARSANLRRDRLREKLMATRQTVTSANDIEITEIHALVDCEVARLPEKYRRPVVLCWLEGASESVAARQLNCPEGTIATRLAKARPLLRARLSRRGITPAAIAAGVAAMEQTTLGGVPPALAAATIHAATTLSTGAIAGGVASTGAMPLAQGVLRAMLFTKLKLAAVLLTAILLTAAGVAQIARTAHPVPKTIAIAEKSQAQPAPAIRPAGVDPKADEMLDKSIAQLAALRSYAVRVDYTGNILHHVGADASNAEYAGWISSADVRADGLRFDLAEQTWDLRVGKKEPETQFKNRTLWDGHKEIHRQQYQGPGGQLLVVVTSHEPQYFPCYTGSAAPSLHGIAYRDRVPMAVVMRESGVATLRPKEEDVSGHRCSVIDARTVRGSYTLWLDPEAGYQFRRTLAIKRAGDLSYDDKPVAPQGSKLTESGSELDVHDVQIDRIDGHFVPMQAAQEKKTFVGGGGKYELWREIVRRSNFQFNPDFAKLGAFVMDGIPEDTAVYNPDKDGPFAGVYLKWRHGEAVFAGVKPVEPLSHEPKVGTLAPQIEGTDMNGKSMRLSDYRGKVVALVFWSTTCPPCMEMVPHERELVARLKDKPFVLLGVSSFDSREKAKAAMTKERMAWPSWFDGGGNTGPIQLKWDIRAWPAIFVIDGKGTIRYKDVRGEELDQAVDALLKEIE